MSDLLSIIVISDNPNFFKTIAIWHPYQPAPIIIIKVFCMTKNEYDLIEDFILLL